jgi:hypothetical protein
MLPAYQDIHCAQRLKDKLEEPFKLFKRQRIILIISHTRKRPVGFVTLFRISIAAIVLFKVADSTTISLTHNMLPFTDHLILRTIVVKLSVLPT